MNFKTFGGKIVAGILAAVTMTTLAIPASANWCTHIYGSKHSYETQYNIDAGERWFLESVTVSAAYAVMKRCQLEPRDYIDEEDFEPLFEYFTPETAEIVGTAVNQIDREILREIEITLRNHERAQQRENEVALQERSADHDRVQAERGLLDPGPQAEGNQTHREIREDEKEIPDGEPADPVQQDDAEREPVPAPAGDRGDDGAEDGGTDPEAGGDGGRSVPGWQQPDPIHCRLEW